MQGARLRIWKALGGPSEEAHERNVMPLGLRGEHCALDEAQAHAELAHYIRQRDSSALHYGTGDSDDVHDANGDAMMWTCQVIDERDERTSYETGPADAQVRERGTNRHECTRLTDPDEHASHGNVGSVADSGRDESDEQNCSKS